jgi:hypothetical protein
MFRALAGFVLVGMVSSACSSSPVERPPRSDVREPPAYMAGGTVLGVERGSPSDPATHVHLVIQPSDGAPVRVDLGPGWYLDERGLRFSKDDFVEVEGRPERRKEGDVVVAKRVRKGETTVELDQPAPTSR